MNYPENQFKNESENLLGSARYRAAKKELLSAMEASSQKVRGIKQSSSAEAKAIYLKQIQDFVRDRGRDIYFPFLSSGLGSGPYVELVDGSVKLDLITGIGINFFGHSHPEIMSEMIDALGSDPMQGNLAPGEEVRRLLELLVKQVRGTSRLEHGWVTTCGTMANEVALKIIRQKHAPATKILAFRDCFCGRSTAMQEITDNPSYRQGQPLYGEVEYLTFYDESLGHQASIEKTLEEMRAHLAKHPGKFCALMMEPIQGEGGFKSAPKDFYVKVFDEAKKAGLAIWLDEIQTFGRTGELFAFQKLGLDHYVDVVTVAKLLQAAVVLYSKEYTPKPALMGGTFTGSSAVLRIGRRILELLIEGGYLGENGKIQHLSRHFVNHLNRLKETSCRGMIGEIRAVGGMIGFTPFSGKMDEVKAVLMKLFDLGAVAFYCGHDPYLVRLLPPLGVMNEADIDLACQLIERALREVKEAQNTKTGNT